VPAAGRPGLDIGIIDNRTALISPDIAGAIKNQKKANVSFPVADIVVGLYF